MTICSKEIIGTVYSVNTAHTYQWQEDEYFYIYGVCTSEQYYLFTIKIGNNLGKECNVIKPEKLFQFFLLTWKFIDDDSVKRRTFRTFLHGVTVFSVSKCVWYKTWE